MKCASKVFSLCMVVCMHACLLHAYPLFPHCMHTHIQSIEVNSVYNVISRKGYWAILGLTTYSGISTVVSCGCCGPGTQPPNLTLFASSVECQIREGLSQHYPCTAQVVC